ncbi:hypothetical protein, partial [Gluconobacter japonicus]|uniref:hypothetical protein n=1 Tax=Gluconobacter japonicus TaxID=376620 RepID=UPI0039ED7FB7
HNLKAAGSNPAPATMNSALRASLERQSGNGLGFSFIVCLAQILECHQINFSASLTYLFGDRSKGRA